MKIPVLYQIECAIRGLKKELKSTLNRCFVKKRLTNLLKNRKLVKLHLGCGKVYKDGWINVDSGHVFNNEKNLDLVYDLAKGFPFESDSIDYIFHEHLIEHLKREHGLALTKNCFSALKKGGVLRIAYPDLDMMIDSYQSNYKDYGWYFDIYPDRKGLTSSEILNLNFRENGEHRHMYNKSDITKLLCQSGFKVENIKFYNIYESDFEELKNLEHRTASVCVEGIKK